MKNNFFFLLILFIFFSCKNERKADKIASPKNIEILVPDFINQLIIAAKIDSNNINLQLQIVKSLDSLGFYKQALQTIDKLINTDSLNNIFWLKRGQICKELEDTVAAIKAFKYAAKIYPTPMALMELANLYAETKNPLALSISNQLMLMNPSNNYNAQAYFFIGVYYAKIKDNKNALMAYDKSIENDFHFDETYIEKGILFFNEKKYNEALEVFQQLTKISQTNSEGYYWQAKCFEIQNNNTKAIESYEKALLLNSKLNEATTALKRLKK